MPSAFPEPSLAIPLVAALNALLNAQPAALSRLQRHAGKTVRLALPVFPQNLSLDDDGRFFPQIEPAEAEPALILTPMPSALPLLLGDGKLADLFRVEGDGLFASDISGALADFDWVLALRPWLGDIAPGWATSPPAGSINSCAARLPGDRKRMTTPAATWPNTPFTNKPCWPNRMPRARSSATSMRCAKMWIGWKRGCDCLNNLGMSHEMLPVQNR
jgi:hypothetical protein